MIRRTSEDGNVKKWTRKQSFYMVYFYAIRITKKIIVAHLHTRSTNRKKNLLNA